MSLATPEGIIKNDIRLALGRYPDLVLWNNSSGVANNNGRTFRYGLAKGAADLVGILTINNPTLPSFGLSIWIEVKSDVGRQSDDQKLFEQLVTRRGAVYILARSVEDAVNGIEATRNKYGSVAA